MTDDDLLTPTLDTTHDLRGFRSPWDPKSVVFAAFFVGPFAAGWLIGENFRRLGQKERFTPWFLGFFALGVATVGLVFWAQMFRDGVFYAENRSVVRVVAPAATVGLALVAAKLQSPRWRIFETSGRTAGGLFVPAIVAAVLGFVAATAIARAFAAVYA